MERSISGRAGAFVGSLAWGHVNFATDNRLNSGLLRRLIKLDHSIHVAMVGNGNRRHPVFDRFFHQVRDPDRAVQKRVFSVQVEMNERVSHVTEKFNSAKGRPQAGGGGKVRSDW